MSRDPEIRVIAVRDKINKRFAENGQHYTQLWCTRKHWRVILVNRDTVIATYKDRSICAVLSKSLYKRICWRTLYTAFIEIYEVQLFSGEIIPEFRVVEDNGCRNELAHSWRGEIVE